MTRQPFLEKKIYGKNESGRGSLPSPTVNFITKDGVVMSETYHALTPPELDAIFRKFGVEV
jgi:hypothetical protein